MYNSKAVILGIIIFVVLFTSPFWASMLGKSYTSTGIALPKNEKECVENVDFMRDKHMQLLNEWRDEALRKENRTYVASNGKKWTISLQNTCMSCHVNKAEFCDKCHDSNSVSPYCWDCHVEPRGNK